MTIEEHHLLCIGLLAEMYRTQHVNHAAIEQAVKSAEELGLPVSSEKLKDLKPLFKVERN